MFETLKHGDLLKKTAVEAETDIAQIHKTIDEISERNEWRVLESYRKHKVSDTHFTPSTGYGYDEIAPTIALKNLNADYQDTLDASLTIAKAVGKESAMEKKLAEHKQKLDELKQKFGSRKQSILLLGNTNEEITVRDENFFTSQLLTKIGYTYGVGDSGKGDAENGESVNIKMTLEQLLEKDPDVIVLMTGEKDKVDEDGKRPIEKDPHHGGIEEYVLVSRGAIAVTACDYTCSLNEGDAMHFTANTVHTYENNTEQTASCYTLIYYPRKRRAQACLFRLWQTPRVRTEQ